MKKSLLIGVGLLVSMRGASAQFGGGAMGGGAMRDRNNYESPAQNERSKRQLRFDLSKEDAGATWVDASVLINVRADEYVAVFALSRQEKTALSADTQINATITGFKASLATLGVRESDVFVDFVLQNRVYTYAIDEAANRAREELAGFEIKKNVSVHFKNKLLLDQMVSRAAQVGIYDLVKVDYVVKNIAAIQAQLQTETARVVKTKIERYSQLGVKSLGAVQIVADLPSIYYPLANYTSYQSSQTNSIELPDRFTTESALKTSTFYFNPLDGNGFDVVINPVIIEPVVQFTSYVRLKCLPPQTIPGTAKN